jgi:hypothetical protein
MYLDLGTNGISFADLTSAAATRSSLGLGATWLTNTSVTNFRTDIGLGATNSVTFGVINLPASILNTNTVIRNGNNGFSWPDETSGRLVYIHNNNVSFVVDENQFITYGKIESLGGLSNNGTIYGSKTNVGAFEGIGNFFAPNNTTLSNETLFRVGLAEQTNRSAQFGFRVARTNNGGEGLAVFSVYGYNALMMIGPSDRSRSNSLTNTNAAIEADIYSISETNNVATLIDTNTGAFTLHRPIGFRTNETNASPTNAGNFGNHAAWLKINIGTNTFYVPVYQ